MLSHAKIIVNKVEEAIVPALEAEGMECVDVLYLSEHGRWVLRITLDKPGGVTLEDCERMTKRISPMLDTILELSGSYSVEVSSPGLNRPLKKPADFDRFKGERARISLFAPQEGQRNFLGVLHGFQEGNVLLEEAGKTWTFPWTGIAKAQLEPDIKL